MNGNPTVSIIVITYNRKELLKQTIDAILNQSYQDFEIIIVDNYSNYDFLGLINSYNSDKIFGYQTHNNGIIAISRNVGIEKARGKYLAFCDDDDIWLQNKLEIQVPLLECGKYDLLSSSIYLFGDEIKDKILFVQKYKSNFEPYVYSKLTPSTVMVVNRKEVRFNESSEVNCMEDWTLWLTLIIINKFRLYQIEEPLVLYRVFAHNLSKSNKNKGKKAINILLSLYKSSPKSFRLDYLLRALAFNSVRAVLISMGLLNTLRNIKHRIKGDSENNVL